MPNAPKGTKRNMRACPHRCVHWAQRNEPTAIPTQKRAKNKVTTCSFADKTCFVYVGSNAKKDAPKNQNHEMHRMLPSNTGSFRMTDATCKTGEIGFLEIRNCG